MKNPSLIIIAICFFLFSCSKSKTVTPSGNTTSKSTLILGKWNLKSDTLIYLTNGVQTYFDATMRINYSFNPYVTFNNDGTLIQSLNNTITNYTYTIKNDSLQTVTGGIVSNALISTVNSNALALHYDYSSTSGSTKIEVIEHSNYSR